MEIPSSASAQSGDSKPRPTGSSDDLDIYHDWNPSEGAEDEGAAFDSLRIFTSFRGVERRRSVIPNARAADDAALIGAFTLGDGFEEPGSDLRDDFDLNVSLKAPAAPAPAAPAPVPPERRLVLPKPGEHMGDFLIVGELGRGTFARVYLAKQESLGNRLVALKISKAEGDEPEILARLQHTHIVPIHSVHDDPTTGLRMICMPYLGGANLAQVLEAVEVKRADLVNGRSLVEALDAVSQRLQSTTGLSRSIRSIRSFRSTRSLPGHSTQVSPNATTRLAADATSGSESEPPTSFLLNSVPSDMGRSFGTIQSLWTRISGRSRPTLTMDPERLEREIDQPSRQFLREANHIQAAVWIVARLAEGLEHAHSKGLLHRDLKPSNILITDDGTPMLLDFNLATLRRMSKTEDGARTTLGGTLVFMAPEHLDAFHPDGTTSPEAVGEQADLYALALILFEMIAGEIPFPEPRNSTLPLSEVVKLMIDQRSRVPSLRAVCPQVPWSLDSIVTKSLDPDPSRRHARAHDFGEDLRRFLDDLPLKYAPEPSLRERAAKWIRRHPSTTSTTSVALLAVVLLLVAGGVISLLSNNLQGAMSRLKFRNFQSEFSECQLLLNTTSGPVEHLGKGIAIAQNALDHQAAGLWDKAQPKSWIHWLTDEEQTRYREQIVEMILLEARAKTYLANKKGSEADQRDALEWAVQWLDRAERVDPRPTPTLFGDRARYLAALGLADRARRDRAREDQTPPKSSRDFALLGTSQLVKRNWAQAEVALRRAVELDKRRFWAWFGLGYCLFEQGRYLEAAGNFMVCTALEPNFAWPYMNQGLALAHAGRLNEALTAYNQALQHNPRFAEALVNRALVQLELDNLTGAESDLRRAITLDRKEPNVLAALGEVLARLGRRDEAERLYARLLATDPDNQGFRIARAVLRLKADPAGSRLDLEHVLERNPRNARALYVMARLVQGSDRSQALAFANQAFNADPSLSDALQLRALLRARLGDLSAVDDVERLTQAPTATRLYNGACALAILSKTPANAALAGRSLALLSRALEAGFSPTSAAADPDLKPLQTLPEFQALIHKNSKQTK